MQQQKSTPEKNTEIIPEKPDKKPVKKSAEKPARKTTEKAPEKQPKKTAGKAAANTAEKKDTPARAAKPPAKAAGKAPVKAPARTAPKPVPDKGKKPPAPAANELVVGRSGKPGEAPEAGEGEHITTTCITGSAQILVSTTDDNPAAPSHYTADWKQDKLLEQIRKFEQELDDDTEIAIRLASFGSSVTMKVEYIGYQNPDVLYFYGTVGGERAQLIQNMNQLNFLLSAEKKEEKHLPPRRIGFLHEHQAEHAKEAGEDAVE